MSTTESLLMVVPLIGDQLLHPKKYFMQEMCMKEEATSQVSQFTVWYGIIEGEQKTEALRRLAVESPQTFIISWTLLIIQPDNRHVLRAFVESSRYVEGFGCRGHDFVRFDTTTIGRYSMYASFSS